MPHLRRSWCILGMATALCLMPPASAITLEALLEAMPTDTPEQAASLFDDALETGEELVVALCALVASSGEGRDAAVAFALHGLANHAARPGNESARVQVARWYEAALQGVDHPEAQRFFMRLLHVCGDTDTIEVLTPYTCDSVVYDDAIRVIEGIGGANAVKTLSSLACDEVSEAAAAAQTALVRMGHAPPSYITESRLAPDVYDAATTAPAPNMRARIAAASRQALADESMDAPSRVAALRALVHSAGKRALPELVAAMHSPSPLYWGAALEMAGTIPGKVVARTFAHNLADFPDNVRPQVVLMLGGRDEAAARKAVRDALADEDLETRLAAYIAVTSQDHKNILDALMDAMAAAESGAEIQAVKEAMLRLPHPEVSALAASRLDYADDAQQAALLDIIAIRQADRHVEVVWASLDHESSQVRRAALNALAQVGVPEDFERLYALLGEVSGNAEINAVRDALVAIASRTDTRAQALGLAVSLLDQAAGDAGVRLVKTFAALGGAEALDATHTIAESALFGEQPDKEIAEAALETLGTWQHVRAGTMLLDLFSRIEAAPVRLSALRHFTVAVQRTLTDPARQVALLEQALEACSTDAENALVEEVLTKVRPAEDDA